MRIGPFSRTLLSFALLAAAGFLQIDFAALAAPNGFNQGIQLYNSRQYSQALQQFQAAARQNPTDPQIRYYIGLCYQCMNQVTLAKTQYEWVAASSSDARLKAQAQAALAQLSKYSSSRSGKTETATTAGSAQRSAGSTQQTGGSTQQTTVMKVPMAAPTSISVKLVGRLKVIEFTSPDCPVCKQFAPVWDRVSSANAYRGKVEFQKVDTEKEKDSPLLAKYGPIRGTPTFIYTDNTGAVLLKEEGARPGEIFVSVINGFLTPRE